MTKNFVLLNIWHPPYSSIMQSISKYQTTDHSIGLTWSNVTREVSIFLGMKWCLQMFLPRHDFVKNSKAKLVLLKERMCMTVQVYGSILYIYTEYSYTNCTNMDGRKSGFKTKTSTGNLVAVLEGCMKNSGLGLRVQLLATQSRVIYMVWPCRSQVGSATGFMMVAGSMLAIPHKTGAKLRLKCNLHFNICSILKF